jgi:threonine dehydrogenase-like Zn-dependent dehydrogenase
MFGTVLATDIAPHRLQAANKHGAEALPLAELKVRLAELTNGRGADAVLEVVGHASALVTATELARPFGVVSSCGVHNLAVTLPGTALYGKK